MLNVPREFQTERLLLRQPTLDDAEPIFRAYAVDPEVTRYLSWPPHTAVDDTTVFLKRCVQDWSDGSTFPYVIELSARPGAPIGMIHMRPDGHIVMFGYVLARPCWGRGYMAEALTCLVDWALEQEEIWRAAIMCDVANPASGRVAEKAGLDFEGILRRYGPHTNVSPEPSDCRIYAKVKP